MSKFADLFRRGPSVGAPVATTTTANLAYPYAPIVIQPPMVAGQGDPSQTIFRMLEEIRSFPVGAQFFMALSAADKQIGVRYAGPNNNQAAGGVRGYVLLRQKHDAQNAVGFGQELQQTLNNLQAATGNGIPWVAERLYYQQVATWNNQQVRPYRNPAPPVVAAPHGGNGTKPLPQTPPTIIAGLINAYLAGTALPSRDEADAIMLVLEDYLNPGAGVATRIYFDPHKEVVNGMTRPPHCGLFHELTHAYYNALGRQLGREDSLDEGNGGRLFELMSVGLGPFATRPFSENAFRTALGIPLRLSYP